MAYRIAYCRIAMAIKYEVDAERNTYVKNVTYHVFLCHWKIF